MYSLLFGQVSHFILLILILNYFYRKKSYLSGFLTGLIFLKLQWLVFGWYFLLVAKDKTKYLISLAGTLTGMFLLSTYIYGTTFIFDYPKYLFGNETSISGFEARENFNLQGIRAIFLGKRVSLEIVIAGLIFYVLALAYLERKNFPEDLMFGITIILGLIFNSHSMAPDLVYIFIPLVILYNIKEKTGNKWYKALYLGLFLLPAAGAATLQWMIVLLLFLIAIILWRIPYEKSKPI
jgi:hypothetical protein